MTTGSDGDDDGAVAPTAQLLWMSHSRFSRRDACRRMAFAVAGPAQDPEAETRAAMMTC